MAAPHVYFSRQMLKAKYKDPKQMSIVIMNTAEQLVKMVSLY